jgi:hypothetical protein
LPVTGGVPQVVRGSCLVRLGDSLRAGYTARGSHIVMSIRVFVLLFSALLASADAVHAESPNLIPQVNGIEVVDKTATGSVTPGGGGAWLTMSVGGEYSQTYYHDAQLVADSDNDGRVTLGLRFAHQIGVWLLVDVINGSISSIGKPPQQFPRGLLLRDTNGDYTWVVHRESSWLADYLWVRPGVGAWVFYGYDGSGSSDFDRTENGLLAFTTSAMKPLGTSPPPPASGVRAGDVFLHAQSHDWKGIWWFGDRVDTHLGSASAAGSVTLATEYVGMQENSGNAPLAVVRTGGSDGTISVKFATAEIAGSSREAARAGVDYTAISGTLTFAQGEIVKWIEVPVIDDQAWRGRRVVYVKLSDPVNTSVLNSSARVSIEENDPKVRLTLSPDQTVSEGDVGTRSVEFLVGVDGPIALDFQAKWSVWCTGDPFATGTIDFSPSSASSQIIRVPIVGDTIQEPDRTCTLYVAMADADPGNLSRALIIRDDDFVDVTVADTQVGEGAKAKVTVSLSASSLKPVSFHYTTEDGTAKAGQDYTAVSGTVTTTNSQSIDIPILQDTAAEGAETLTLVLSFVENGRIVRDRATVTIVDDDAPPVPIFTATSVEVNENPGVVARIPVRLSTPSPTEVRVRVTASDGTALAGTDYQRTSSFLIFAPGVQERFLEVPIVNDDVPEPMETFLVTLSDAVGGTIGSSAVPVVIRDEDRAAPITTSVEDILVVEGTSSTPTVAVFTVRLSRPSESLRSISAGFVSETAIDGVDFKASRPLPYVTFQPGEVSATIELEIMADSTPEPPEQFALQLDGRLVARCTILDDDVQPGRRRSARH